MDSIINCRFARRVSCGIPTFSANTQYGTCNLDCDSPDERLYNSVEANCYNHRNMDNLTFNPDTRSQCQVSMTPVFQPLQVNDVGPVLIERACPIPSQRRFEASCQIIKETILEHTTLDFHVKFVSELCVTSNNLCTTSELESVSQTSVSVARVATYYSHPVNESPITIALLQNSEPELRILAGGADCHIMLPYSRNFSARTNTQVRSTFGSFFTHSTPDTHRLINHTKHGDSNSQLTIVNCSLKIVKKYAHDLDPAIQPTSQSKMFDPGIRVVVP